MLLKKLSENLGDPGKFLIPCDFPEIDDKIGSKPDKNGKRGEAGKSQKQLQLKEEEKPKKTKKEWPKTHARIKNEAVTFNLNQTTRTSSTYNDLSVNRIDIIDVAREEYARDLGFSNNSSGGNPTSIFEPILSNSSPSLTPFEGSDFILEKINAYLKDESVSSKTDHADCDPQGDICLIEKLLNNYPFQLPPMDLKQGEVVTAKSSIKEPLEL
nr:reverse transcriptase domain-containing protein [Tanacetum cinerariifolium]